MTGLGPWTRRRFLKATGALGLAGLAGCTDVFGPGMRRDALTFYHMERPGYLIITPSGGVHMFEAPRAGNRGPEEDRTRGNDRFHGVIPFLEELGIERLDTAWVSHWHDDHVEGFAPIIEALDGRVGALYSSGMMANPAAHAGRPRDVVAQEKVLAAAQAYGVPHVPVTKGFRVPDEDPRVEFEVLHPRPEDVDPIAPVPDEDSMYGLAASAVVSVRFGQFSLLLTGDIRAEHLRDVVLPGASDPRFSVYYASHHGDPWNADDGLMAMVEPELVIGIDNQRESYVQYLEERGIPFHYHWARGRMELRAFADGSFEHESIANRFGVNWSEGQYQGMSS